MTTKRRFASIMNVADTRLFAILWVLAIIAALLVTINVPKGGVWNDHVRDGIAFLQGDVPDPPTYPIWGYSILAGLFGDYIVLVQALLLASIGIYWYSATKSGLAEPASNLSPTNVWPQWARRLSFLDSAPVVVLLLLPFAFLAVSYYSNSMTYLLIISATWLLCVAVERDKHWTAYAVPGLLFGIAANIRSEALLLGALLGAAMVTCGLLRGKFVVSFRHTLIFGAVIFVSTLPWQLYTYKTVGEASMSATNGGASMYLGLGLLHDNPWGIEHSDEYVADIANAHGLGSPWSYESNKYFKQEFSAAIREHPGSYAKRIVHSWMQMLAQGVYMPDFRELLKNENDLLLIDVINEDWKGRLGLNVNRNDVARYRELGLSSDDVSLKHYLVLFFEYGLRAFYAAIFLVSLALALYVATRSRPVRFISLVLVAYIGFELTVTFLITSVPRHTTILLPVLLMTLMINSDFASNTLGFRLTNQDPEASHQELCRQTKACTS